MGMVLIFVSTNCIKIFSDSEDPKLNLTKKNLRNSFKGKNLSKYKTSYNFITKFEKTRIIGLRALQLSSGSRANVLLEGETDPIQIALKEFREKKIPFKIRRYFPDGSYEDYELSELLDID